MRQLTLTRIHETDEGTFGSLVSKDGRIHLLTGECPWRDNAPYKSCIPEGNYFVNWHQSAKFGNCCILSPTEPRTLILIHRGNYCGDVDKGLRSDVQGCIVVGMGRRKLSGPRGPQECVAQSRPAFEQLMGNLWRDGTDPWGLEIIWSQAGRPDA